MMSAIWKNPDIVRASPIIILFRPAKGNTSEAVATANNETKIIFLQTYLVNNTPLIKIPDERASNKTCKNERS